MDSAVSFDSAPHDPISDFDSAPHDAVSDFDTAPDETPSTGDYVTGLAAQAGQGLTAGMGTRMAAGEQALIDQLPQPIGNGMKLADSYNMHKMLNTNSVDEFAKENPKASLAANVVGSLPTMALAGEAGLNPTVANAAYGALSGASSSDDLLSKDALKNAAIGGGTGAALANVVPLGKKASNTVGNLAGLVDLPSDIGRAIAKSDSTQVPIVRNYLDAMTTPKGAASNPVTAGIRALTDYNPLGSTGSDIAKELWSSGKTLAGGHLLSGGTATPLIGGAVATQAGTGAASGILSLMEQSGNNPAGKVLKDAFQKGGLAGLIQTYNSMQGQQ